MEVDDEPWTRDRLRGTLAEVLDVFLPGIEPDGDVDAECLVALRHHLDQAHTILSNPNVPPPRYFGQRNFEAIASREETAAERIANLTDLARELEPPIHQDELLQLVRGGLPPEQHCLLEDAAIIRAFRGYQGPDEGDSDDDDDWASNVPCPFSDADYLRAYSQKWTRPS